MKTFVLITTWKQKKVQTGKNKNVKVFFIDNSAINRECAPGYEDHLVISI